MIAHREIVSVGWRGRRPSTGCPRATRRGASPTQAALERYPEARPVGGRRGRRMWRPIPAATAEAALSEAVIPAITAEAVVGDGGRA